MRTFLDAKVMAKSLRLALDARNVKLGHSDCLELIAKQFGLADWNTLAARIEASSDIRPLRLPNNWRATQHTNPLYYNLGLPPDEPGTVLIESRYKAGSGIDLSDDTYACLMQSILADTYRGSRIRLSADLRTEDTEAASIWMRVDQSPGNVQRFDNMLDRKKDGALRGTHNWTRRSVVLNVPADAASIHYGILLKGHGRVSARSLSLEQVGDQIMPTAGHGRYLDTPSNLDFSEIAPPT